ncbi:hypothetical protein KGF57_001834 [Candida theae]|uniref:Zn(2)-C6 fungal-type domain-containing protein n=1 Tax=Candida theae TaxID=1198502 RepID=A0AAD5BG54_9ASCO|nr:uncharacterized protein KGF57_001834 [Candida theae]KAI5960902.1 hypothetical protein KGF57_001834 [Candida theae]
MDAAKDETRENIKKRRIKQACDYCRTKKAKCDGLSPSCTNCTINNEKCTYTYSSKRRGLPTGYTHELEKKVAILQAVLASAIQQRPEFESAVWSSLENHHDLINNLRDLNQIWKDHSISKFVETILHQESPMFKNFKSLGSLKSEASNGISDGRSSVGSALQSPPSSSSNNNNNNIIVKQEKVTATTTTTTATTPSENLEVAPISNQITYPAAQVASNSQAQEQPPWSFNNNLPTSQELYETNNFVNDPSFFLNYDIFQFISDEVESSGGAENWEPVALQYHGLSSIISGFTNKAIQQNYKKKPNRKNPFRVGSLFNMSSFAINANLQDKIHLPHEIFQFPANVRTLVDNYFQIFHVLFPMLDKINVKRQLHHLQSPHGDARQVDCNLVALIWAVVAIGESSSNVTGDFSAGLTYAKNAILALENSLTSTIETMQAMLILGLFYYQAGQWDYSWVLISSSSRMAIDVRLMRSASDEEDSKYQSSTTLNNISRQRTWANVYVINTLLSARMGRSPVVRASDWPIPQIDTDGWEEYDSWECYHMPESIRLDHGRFLSSFNQFIKIVFILNLAITSTINTSTGVVDDGVVGGKINYDDRRNPSSMTMGNFEAKINDFVRNMPDYCRLKEHWNPAPYLAIEGVKQLVWCVLVVRLSSLKGTNDAHETLIRTRNKQYTKAISVLRNVYRPDVVKTIKIYPFVDYILTMALNFPQMMEFPTDHERVMHCREIRSLLLQNASTSPPMRISVEISQQMNLDYLQFDTPKAQESPTIANLLNSPTQEPQKPVLPKSQRKLIKIEEEESLGNSKESAGEEAEVESQARALLSGVNALSPPPIGPEFKEKPTPVVRSSSSGQFGAREEQQQFPMVVGGVMPPIHQSVHHQPVQHEPVLHQQSHPQPVQPIPHGLQKVQSMHPLPIIQSSPQARSIQSMQPMQPMQPLQPNQGPIYPIPQKNFQFYQSQHWVPPGNNNVHHRN